ncbi:MAG: tetratricopeptide repeat protein [Myxococcota bacterium]|nr:tetratricopeptide repeat protein [Myxococcota bacterium]
MAEQDETLGPRFLAALEKRRTGDVTGAEEDLKEVLLAEPRLPEPRLELGHIYLEAGRIPEAESEIREGLRWLEQGGQWVEDISENQALSLAHGLLGEVLRARCESDEAVFGDEEDFKALLKESRTSFEKAAKLDPENEYAAHHAFFLGLEEE